MASVTILTRGQDSSVGLDRLFRSGCCAQADRRRPPATGSRSRSDEGCRLQDPRGAGGYGRCAEPRGGLRPPRAWSTSSASSPYAAINKSFLEVNVDGPRIMGEAARAAGAKSVVLVSAIGARLDPHLKYLTSRWMGRQEPGQDRSLGNDPPVLVRAGRGGRRTK